VVAKPNQLATTITYGVFSPIAQGPFQAHVPFKDSS